MTDRHVAPTRQVSERSASPIARASAIVSKARRPLAPFRQSALAAAYDLEDRSGRVGAAVSKVLQMRLPFPPQLVAMGELDEVVAAAADIRGRRQIGCLLLEPTGCGKSTMVEAFAEVMATRAAPGEAPVILCRAPANGTAIGLYSNILAALGDHFANFARENRMLSHVEERLDQANVQLVVIDETDRGAETSGLGGQITSAIKSIMDTGIAAVAVVGTDKSAGVIADDKELAGRMHAQIALPPLGWDGGYDEKVWIELVDALDTELRKSGVCDASYGFKDPVCAKKLLEASNGMIGQLMGIARTAVREMARAGRMRLEEADLVFAVDAWSIGYRFIDDNPFRA